MGYYSSITIDRDRAFDINSLNGLLTQGESILAEAVSISQKMEVSISSLSGIYGEIEGEYRVAALGSDIAGLCGKLEKDIHQDTINYMNADNQLAILKVNGKEKLRNSYDKKGNLVSATGTENG